MVIGNPPFETKLTEAAKYIEKEKGENRTLSLLENGKTKEITVKLPDNQISLLFLEQSVKLCKKEGLVCLIQPSGPFLYNNSSFQFRQVLLKKYNIPQIIDFTHISRILFGKNADVATAAVFIKNEASKNKGLLHVTVRRTKPHKEKLYVELDTYNFHYVPYHLALNDPFIWKSNFIGGARSHQLVKRLAALRTLGEYLEQNQKEKNWVYSEGYIAGQNQTGVKRIKFLEEKKAHDSLGEDELLEFEKLELRYKAPYITGSESFEPQNFTAKGISETFTVNNLYFDRKRNPKIYQSPHLLIKEVVENESFAIPAKLVYKELCFKNSIFGIHAPTDTELKEIEQFINGNQLLSFYLAGYSGRFMVNKSSSLIATDIKNIPYPKDFEEIELNEMENLLVRDFIDYLIEFRRKGERSKIVTQNASNQHLIAFADVYCKVLGAVFKSIKPAKFFETESYLCFPFYFGEKPTVEFNNAEQAEKHIAQLVKKDLGINVRVIRMVRLYEGNVIYLIKPKKLRYWLPSIALRDADETFSDLRKQGY